MVVRLPHPSSRAGQSGIETDTVAAQLKLIEPAQLKEVLLSIFKSPKYKPPVLPGVALELTDLTRKNNVSYDEVGRVLARDPMIAAEVLKVAQSPLYSARSPVRSLNDALARLGIEALRDIIWQVVTNMRLFRVKSYTSTMQRLQIHSTFTAHVARMVASSAGVGGEHAFLCGLLHDVGIAGTLIAISEEAGLDVPRLQDLWPGINEMHAEASGMMGKLWGLPPEVCDVIGQHHAFDIEKQTSPLVPVIVVAEKIVSECGWGILPRALEQAGEVVDQNPFGCFEDAVVHLDIAARLAAIKAHARSLSSTLGTGG